MGPSASLLKYRASEYNRAAQIPKLPLREVTTLIHKHSDEFDPQAALVMMKTGRNWPRPEYLDHEVNFGSLARMLMGLDFKYQADLVSLLQKNSRILRRCVVYSHFPDRKVMSWIPLYNI